MSDGRLRILFPFHVPEAAGRQEAGLMDGSWDGNASLKADRHRRGYTEQIGYIYTRSLHHDPLRNRRR